ncbi:MAG: glycoside hydrolase family 5 protein [Pseudomonadota bacterium]
MSLLPPDKGAHMSHCRLCRWLVVMWCVLMSACHAAETMKPVGTPAALVHAGISGFSRGVNLAGDFEVSPRGSWGAPIQDNYFDLIADAGFDHVRIPIRWTAHTGAAPQFRIDPAFFRQVDALLDNAERTGLSVIINTHHFEALNEAPVRHRAQLLAIWKQISTRYRNRPLTVAFEINNEPAGAFDAQPELWNAMAAETLEVIRHTNPRRWIMIGPVGFNHPEHLETLVLPDDKRLIATVHLYDPTGFTLQGAPWMQPSPPTGITWSGAETTINTPWHIAGWDSMVTTEQGVSIEFKRKHAAFAVRRATHNAPDQTSESTLLVSADRPFNAVALCNIWQDVVAAELLIKRSVNSQADIKTVADLSGCSTINSIAVQLDDDSLVSPLITSMHLCETETLVADICSSVLVTQREYHQQVMQRTAQWALRQGVPMYLGEFGVFDPVHQRVDQQSKFRWITSVRQAAEQYGIGWSFFEFANDFGVYDNVTKAWRQPMLDALLE